MMILSSTIVLISCGSVRTIHCRTMDDEQEEPGLRVTVYTCPTTYAVTCPTASCPTITYVGERRPNNQFMHLF
ncbi:hypothetical protein F4811DRAFT_524957 [Daldinia bambusicola]|nr:hypothetical protein F4811DRAFT_524957 [Daldinia bambusicola]